MFSVCRGGISFILVVSIYTTTTSAQFPQTYQQGQTQQRIPAVITDDHCSDCDIRNGVGYNPHPSDCNKYLQCFPKGDGGWRAVVRSCPPGLFWQQSHLTCNRPDQVDCAHDRCQGVVKTKTSDDDDCRAYWICNGGKSVDMDWCGPFQRYDDDKDDCDDDRSCVDDDPDDHDRPSPRPCPYEEDDTDESKYYVYEWGRKRMMPCPARTAFSWNLCVCYAITPGVGHGCKAELYLPFDSDFRDHAGNNWVDNRGAYLRAVPGAVGGKAAYFNGNASVIVPRFTGHDFRQTVLIKVRYLEDDSRSRLQAVITNSDCYLVPSIAIAHDNIGSSTKGILRTGSVSEYFTHVGHAPRVWKEVTYRYDGRSFVLTVNGNSDGVTATGNIRVVNSALHIGDGAGFANFKGYIDEVWVYLCNP